MPRGKPWTDANSLFPEQRKTVAALFLFPPSPQFHHEKRFTIRYIYKDCNRSEPQNHELYVFKF